MPPVGLAIIGAGKFTRRVHIPNLEKVPGLKLRACVDLVEETAAAAARLGHADYSTTDLDRVLADPEVDAVLIGSRADSHVPLAIQAARAGKAVFCEKPLGATVAECRELIAVLEQTRTPLMVGYCYRFNAAVENLHARLTPEFSVVHVHCKTGETTRDFFVDNACHALDLLCHFHRSEPVQVTAQGNRPSWPGPFAKAEGWLSINIHFANGALATLVAAPRAGSFSHKWLYKFCAADGRVGEVRNYCESRVLGDAAKEFSEPGAYYSGHVKELRLFAEAVSAGTPPPVTARDGLRVNLLLDAVERSYESGRPEAVAPLDGG